MQRLRTRVLLASVLAIGAQLAGCGDVTDCPGNVADRATCSTAGLSCYANGTACHCLNGSWRCDYPDIHFPMPPDMRLPPD